MMSSTMISTPYIVSAKVVRYRQISQYVALLEVSVYIFCRTSVGLIFLLNRSRMFTNHVHHHFKYDNIVLNIICRRSIANDILNLKTFEACK